MNSFEWIFQPCSWAGPWRWLDIPENPRDDAWNKNGNENTIKPRSLWANFFTEKNDITLVDITLKHDKLEDIETLIEMGFKEGFGMALLNLDQLLLTKNKKRYEVL